MMDKGMAINSLTDFTIWIGQPSGPGDFPLCKSISFPKTTPGLKSIESTAGEQSAESSVGVKVLSLAYSKNTGKVIIELSIMWDWEMTLIFW